MTRVKIHPASDGEWKNLTDLVIQSKKMRVENYALFQQLIPHLVISRAYIQQHLVYKLTIADILAGFYSLNHLNKDLVQLDHFYVHPEFIRKGIGKQLIEHALQTVNKQYSKVFVEAEATSISFYTRFGFYKVGELTGLLERRITLMEKDL